MSGVEKDHNDQVSTSLLCSGLPTNRPGCPEPHLVWPWMPPGWGIHNLLGQPVPVCHHPLCEKLLSNLNLPCPSLKPFPLVLSLSTLVNSRSPSCLYAPFKYWKATAWGVYCILQALNSLKPLFFLYSQSTGDENQCDRWAPVMHFYVVII